MLFLIHEERADTVDKVSADKSQSPTKYKWKSGTTEGEGLQPWIKHLLALQVHARRRSLKVNDVILACKCLRLYKISVLPRKQEALINIQREETATLHSLYIINASKLQPKKHIECTGPDGTVIRLICQRIG